jgi:hypothetical protein
MLEGGELNVDIFSMIFGWNWKVQRTRRRWDRLREHALEKEGRVRKEALKELDVIEDKLKMLEEESLTRRDRVRLMREVQMALANIADLLERGEAWLATTPRTGIKKPQGTG